jgi:hypothetical protein
MGSRHGMRVGLGALAVFGTLAVTKPGRADVCYELVEAIHHPAVFEEDCLLDIDDLDVTDLLCLQIPVCCVPHLCLTNPACFVRILVKDAFNETQKCDLTFEDAFEAWLQGTLYLNPGPLQEIVDEMWLEGEPIPPGLVRLFNQLRKSHLTKDLDWPSAFELSQIRVIREGDAINPVASLLPEGANGMTLSDVIVLKDGRYDLLYNEPAPTIQDFECGFDPNGDRASYYSALRTLIHEIVHTMQYRNVGAVGFYAGYVFGGGETEEEAEEIPGQLYENAINSTCGGSDSAQLVGRSGEALFGFVSVLINDRAEVRSAGFEAGTCGGSYHTFPCYGRVVTPSLDGAGVRIGVEAGVGQILSAAHVELRDRSFVEDYIETSATVVTGNDVSVGPIYQSSSPQETFFLPRVAFPAMAAGISLEPGQRFGGLQAGAYRYLRLKPGSVMNLVGGTYYFDEVEIDVGAAVGVIGLAEPVTRVFVRNRLDMKGSFISDPRSTLLFVSEGGVEVTGDLSGTLFVPHGKVSIYRGPEGPNGFPKRRGSVYAREIELHQDTVFIQVPFEHPWISEEVALESPPEDPPVPPTFLTGTIAVTSDWGTGYCAVLNVSNTGSTPSSWVAQLSTTGSLVNNVWNATTTTMSDVLTLTPYEWNGMIPAGTTNSSVGFCATRTTPGTSVSVLAVAPS